MSEDLKLFALAVSLLIVACAVNWLSIVVFGFGAIYQIITCGGTALLVGYLWGVGRSWIIFQTDQRMKKNT